MFLSMNKNYKKSCIDEFAIVFEKESISQRKNSSPHLYNQSLYLFRALVENTPSLAKPLFEIVQTYVQNRKVDAANHHKKFMEYNEFMAFSQFIKLFPDNYRKQFLADVKNRAIQNAQKKTTPEIGELIKDHIKELNKQPSWARKRSKGISPGDYLILVTISRS